MDWEFKEHYRSSVKKISLLTRYKDDNMDGREELVNEKIQHCDGI